MGKIKTFLLLSLIMGSFNMVAQSTNYWNVENIRATAYVDDLDDDILEISSAAELGLLAYELQGEEARYEGKIIRLTADIDLSMYDGEECYWEPMPASGINFDGNGKKIIGMVIMEKDIETTNDNSIGFFSNLKEAIVHDVLFENPSIQVSILSSTSSSSFDINVGIVAGRAEGMGIADIIIENPEILVENNSTICNPRVGAVIGYGYGYEEPVTVPGIIVPMKAAFIQGVDITGEASGNAQGSISVISSGTSMQNLYVGSIAGALYKSSISSTLSEVDLHVEIKSTVSSSGDYVAIGGIVGYTSSTAEPESCLFNNVFKGDITFINDGEGEYFTIYKGGVAGYVLNDDVINNVVIGTGWTDKYGYLSNTEEYLPLDKESDKYNFSYTDLSEMSQDDYEYLISKVAPEDPSISLEGAGGLWLAAYFTINHADVEIALSNMDDAFATHRSMIEESGKLFFNWWMLGDITAPSLITEGDNYSDVLTVPVKSLVLYATHAIDESNTGWEISPDGINDWAPLPEVADYQLHNEKYIRYKVTYKYNSSLNVNKVSYSNAVQIAIEADVSGELPILNNSAMISGHFGKIHVTLSTGVIENIYIYDTKGQLIYKDLNVNAGSYTTLEIPQGLYIVNVVTTEGNQSEKIRVSQK